MKKIPFAARTALALAAVYAVGFLTVALIDGVDLSFGSSGRSAPTCLGAVREVEATYRDSWRVVECGSFYQEGFDYVAQMTLRFAGDPSASGYQVVFSRGMRVVAAEQVQELP